MLLRMVLGRRLLLRLRRWLRLRLRLLVHHRRSLHSIAQRTLLQIVWRVELSRLLVQLVHLVHLVHLAQLAHVTELLHLVHLIELLQVVELLECRVVVHASLHCGGGCCRCCHMLLIAASRVGIVVDTRVPRELVRSAEALRAAWELASVRLLARVRADMSRLVLQTVEGLVAQGTLVRSWQVGAMFILTLHTGRHCGHGHGRACHGR